jgi:predicted Ser/Thr protein kinase
MTSKLKKAIVNFNRDQFRAINTEMSFGEYLDLCYENPKLLRNSWQTIYDMIMDKGIETFEEYRKNYVNYK